MSKFLGDFVFFILHVIFCRGGKPPVIVPPLTDTFYHRTEFYTGPNWRRQRARPAPVLPESSSALPALRFGQALPSAMGRSLVSARLRIW